MVGPCGLEPQTSTVSIWWPHNHRVTQNEIKCITYKQMAFFCALLNDSYHSVDSSDRTASVLKSVLKWPGMNCAETGSVHKTGHNHLVSLLRSPALRVVFRSPRGRSRAPCARWRHSRPAPQGKKYKCAMTGKGWESRF